MSSPFEDYTVEQGHLSELNPYDAARAESDLAFIAKKRREIEWWQHNIAAAEEKIARAEERLKSFAIMYRQTVGGSQISLANGFVSISKQRERTEIYDREAWQKWAEAHKWPEEFYFKRLTESKVKSVLRESANGGFEFVMEEKIAGQPVVEVVPGIRRVKPGPLDFNVKINAGRGDESTTRRMAEQGAASIEESNDADESE